MDSSGFITDDGQSVSEFIWRPDGSRPRAVVQILHGLGEHASRYERFAKECTSAGFVVWAHDHRGHGARPGVAGHFADSQGWDKVINDAWQVNERIRARYEDVPIVLLGHSMGSYIAQSFLFRHPALIAALILSASTFANKAELLSGHGLATMLAATAKQQKSALLNRLGFGKFNKPFQPTRTDLDWLSRDEEEVDRYIDDPLCGGTFTNALWRDLTGGLLEITSRTALHSVPRNLPILITGGEKDPVGGTAGMQRLAAAYRDTGHGKVDLKVYPGGRHEMLNEINRREVMADLIHWINSVLA